MSSSNIALLDLDGTVADYDGAMRVAMGRLQSPNDPEYDRDNEPKWMEARRRLISSQPGFWRNLPLLTTGIKIYALLKELGFETHVLTKGPSSKSRAWMEKVEWCREHLPAAKVTITEDKTLVYGKVLVDDWPEYFEPWMKNRPRGLVVVPTRPWNAECDLPPNAIRASTGNLDYVKDCLIAARDRRDGDPLVLPLVLPNTGPREEWKGVYIPLPQGWKCAEARLPVFPDGERIPSVEEDLWQATSPSGRVILDVGEYSLGTYTACAVVDQVWMSARCPKITTRDVDEVVDWIQRFVSFVKELGV